ncbi:MAG: response regulator transcription factor [Vicinamibacterales bacterium]
MPSRILIVEDDATLSRVLRDTLVFEGFEVRAAADGSAAIGAVQAFRPHLVVLDVMLPDTSGFELCERLRESREKSGPGIVMLTARSQKVDKLRGLACGADDYVTKPFDLEELLARVRAVLRRAGSPSPTVVLGDVVIDFVNLMASRGRTLLRMSHREFEVLRFLAENAEEVVHRDELLRQVWGYPDLPETRAVDHAIARLRKKIEPEPGRPRFIHTVHGDGYCLTLTAKAL